MTLLLVNAAPSTPILDKATICDIFNNIFTLQWKKKYFMRRKNQKKIYFFSSNNIVERSHLLAMALGGSSWSLGHLNPMTDSDWP